MSRVLVERTGRRWIPVAMLAAVLVIGGCTTEVDGDPTAAPVTGVSPNNSNGSSDLRERSVAPADFPVGYSATEVTGGQLGALLGDTAGVAAGGTVDPPTCAPRQLPSDPGDATAFVATGTGANAGALSAVTVLVDTPLAELKADLTRCPTYTTDTEGAKATVTTTVLPSSPAQSEESLAFRRVTSSGAMTQTMTALVGQNDGIRVYVTYVASGQRPPDGMALDQLYTTALARSRG
ncbi:hypothetical protein [Williamsia soli]|uniref:hypothetical protein n=1 Tax=Williamsia soli TaxID=364929 RepID=UPI001A9D80F8|nr:hypothetical protein [Williamsia soli]